MLLFGINIIIGNYSSFFPEPNVYHAPDQTPLTPEQIGEDFVSLVHLVRSYPAFQNSSIVGPDVVGVTGDSASIIKG